VNRLRRRSPKPVTREHLIRLNECQMLNYSVSRKWKYQFRYSR